MVGKRWQYEIILILASVELVIGVQSNSKKRIHVVLIWYISILLKSKLEKWVYFKALNVIFWYIYYLLLLNFVSP